jgi:hypothetical protein
MWFDVVEKITGSKTFIIAFHDGRESTKKQLEHMFIELKGANIHSVEIVSLKSAIGAKIAQTYDLSGHTKMIIVRENKQIAWSWSGIKLPLLNEVVYRFNQVG